MKIQLRFFASIREALGQGAADWETQHATVGALRDELLSQGEPWSTALGRGRSVRVSLNQVMVGEDAVLLPNCEVAFFPPVTGG